MPGYELFSADGTLVCRCRRDDGAPIPEDELRTMALSYAPKKIDGKTAKKADFQVREMELGAYLQSRDDHVIEKKGVPKADGKKQSEVEWIEKMKILNPNFVAKEEKK